MLRIDIPGRRPLGLRHVVLDYNGTMAVDGLPLPGVMERLRALAAALTIHVVTADTFGSATAQCSVPFLQLHRIPEGGQAKTKRRFVENLGADLTVAIGNGLNDHEMLDAAAIGLAVVQAEGAHPATLQQADAVFPTVLDALDALRAPVRLIATLRD
jgi:soluble P-type ATPase